MFFYELSAQKWRREPDDRSPRTDRLAVEPQRRRRRAAPVQLMKWTRAGRNNRKSGKKKKLLHLDPINLFPEPSIFSPVADESARAGKTQIDGNISI